MSDCFLVKYRQHFCGAAQRQASAAPLAASTDRHERWGATTPKDRAQLRGRAIGVRCTQCWAASDEIIREKGS